jgi:hypothetical protein
MSQHRPEPAHRFGRQARREHWDITLQIASNEIASPLQALDIIFCKQAVWKPASDPKPVDAPFGSHLLKYVDDTKVKIGDTTSKRFSRLSHEVEACGSKQQELSTPKARSPPLVDDPAQYAEQGGRAVNFIEYDELASLGPDERIRIFNATPVGRSLEIDMDRPASAQFCDGTRKCGFANLARAQQDHSRRLAQPLLDDSLEASTNHHRKYNISC